MVVGAGWLEAPVVVVGPAAVVRSERSVATRRPYPSLHTSAPGPPERSPLEPLGNYLRRKRRWRRNNAKWAGQVRALKNLEKKTTPIPRQPYEV